MSPRRRPYSIKVELVSVKCDRLCSCGWNCGAEVCIPLRLMYVMSGHAVTWGEQFTFLPV